MCIGHNFLAIDPIFRICGPNVCYFHCTKAKHCGFKDGEVNEDQERPRSIGGFLMTIFNLRPHVSYVFGDLRQNPVQC